ncbi:DMT family transporter [Thalassobium sp. R2A62]|uniref:DMT family transporter n=1 Tax=Thalassobium sp. R2A62 TaxID=633131 RepID=UPI0001B1CB1F|nr:DMT family transporter [Thalassobium sp. R2A62]EET46382.1 possible transporter, RhaT family, DMT superfamily [Thalassobium sp. R2A62]
MNTLSINQRGAVLMMVAMSAFAIGDGLMKSLSGGVPLFEAIFLRGVLTSILLFSVVWYRGLLRIKTTAEDKRRILVRCLAEALAAYFFIAALFHMPLGDLTAILQALPLTVTLASAVFLGQTVGWRRWFAILVGFGGVLLIVRPGADSFTIYSVYGVATVICATVRDIVTRSLSPNIPSLTVTLATALAVTLFAGLMGWTNSFGLSPPEPWVIPNGAEIATIIATGVTIILAYLTIIMAMRQGDVSFIAPFRYTGLVVAILVGIIAFGDWPDFLTWIGSGIVVGSGLFAFARERRAEGIAARSVPHR